MTDLFYVTATSIFLGVLGFGLLAVSIAMEGRTRLILVAIGGVLQIQAMLHIVFVIDYAFIIKALFAFFAYRTFLFITTTSDEYIKERDEQRRKEIEELTNRPLSSL